MNETAKDILEHYGMPRRSGRYPYGSGEDPYQHGRDFLGRVEALKKKGWTETPENIKKEFGLSTTDYRKEISNARDARKIHNINTAKALAAEGKGATEIGRIMKKPESTIRGYLKEGAAERVTQAKTTAEFIKGQLKDKKMIDVGPGVERELNISRTMLDKSLKLLEEEGYPTYSGRIPQATNPNQKTTQKVVCVPGTKHNEIYNYENVHTLTDYVSQDGGGTYVKKFVYPKSMDSKRLMIRYKEDGGIDKDGIIELRRGVEDLSLGDSRYSQVRILVDDKKYLKGMAVYSDDMPDGVDVVFNTNKSNSVPKMDVLKSIKEDPNNPFGSLIKENGGQSYYIDKNGNKQLSLINKRADEGDWSDWKDALPSQFLSKQSLQLAKKQLDIAKADKAAEYDEIKSITNPTIKKHYLDKFADECDAAAEKLQAASLPGQKYHVIIPINTLKDDEIYAPQYKDGTKLALVRYPHGGTFEIPVVKVNNKHAAAVKLLGKDVSDAVGINSKVAERLSGADFDGDTVMCIPTHDRQGRVKVASQPPLKGLEGFDPKADYPEREGMSYMRNTNTQMGIISNLITDMTLAGATQDELAAAVRHSMVVIDAEKHKLDYKRSEIDNNIAALKKKYQTGGASTIISRSKGQYSVPKRQGSAYVNIKGKPGYDPTKPEGVKLYKTADDLYYTTEKVNKRTGKIVTETKMRTTKSTKMAEVYDAKDLVSEARHPMEMVYADYANNMKAMARAARLESASTGKIAYNKTAATTYKSEIKSLDKKLKEAELNSPKEREAQRRAAYEVKKLRETTNMKPGELSKAGQRALTSAREELGSVARRNRNIQISDKEWEAIQSGAISESRLIKILNNTDVDNLRQRAMPKADNSLSSAQVSRIKAMSASFTIAQIAEKMGKSPSTISKYLKGEK